MEGEWEGHVRTLTKLKFEIKKKKKDFLEKGRLPPIIVSVMDCIAHEVAESYTTK